MNRNVIEEVFDEVINKFSLKCSRVSRRASVEKAFYNISNKYGLKLEKHEIQETIYSKPLNDGLNYDPVYTLTDKEHNTQLIFTEKFLDDNIISFTPQGNHKNHHISLEEIIQGYMNLPSNNKDSVNMVLFKYLGEKDTDFENTGILAYSTFEDVSAKEMNTITIPSYYFRQYNPTGDGWDNYDFLISHESMHCLDYIRVSGEEYNLRKNKLNLQDLTPTEYKLWLELQGGVTKTNIMSKSENPNEYGSVITNNSNYLSENKVNSNRLPQLNKASDYGASKISEDYAEAGAMVMLGYKNPSNPKAVVRWNGETMQYREWIKLHPYQAQYLVKQVYGENVSIDILLSEKEDTVRNLFPTDD